MVAMETCGMSHRKIGNTDLSSKATRQIGGDQPGPVEGDRGGATATPQGPLRNQTHGETPHRISETRTNDGNRQQRHGARGVTMRQDRSTRPTQRNRLRARSGHSQRATAKPTAEADKATTKKERGMERVSDSDRASN